MIFELNCPGDFKNESPIQQFSSSSSGFTTGFSDFLGWSVKKFLGTGLRDFGAYAFGVGFRDIEIAV